MENVEKIGDGIFENENNIKMNAASETNSENSEQRPQIRLKNFPLVNRSFGIFDEIIENKEKYMDEEEITDSIPFITELFEEKANVLTKENLYYLALQYMYAYDKINSLWVDINSHNFIKHLFVSFCNNKNCQIGIPTSEKMAANKFCSITSLFVASKKEVSEMFDEFYEKFNELDLEKKSMGEYPPIMFKYIWVLTNTDTNCVYSNRSDKVLSLVAYHALIKYFNNLLEEENEEAITIKNKMENESSHNRFKENQKYKRLKTQSMGDFFTKDQINKLRS